MLRNRIGKASLVTVRERCGGLLVLLERHPRLFRVDRIPKNDCVSLVPTTPAMVAQLLSSAASDKGGASSGSGATAEDAVDGAGDAAGAFGGGDAACASQPPGSPGGADHGMSTRCLHVGNVASNMTEANLRAKFGKYGPIEALKCVPALRVCMCLSTPAQPLTFAPTAQAGFVPEGPPVCVCDVREVGACRACACGADQAKHLAQQHLVRQGKVVCSARGGRGLC